MPGPLVAGIAGSIGSAVIQGKAADKAAKAQGAAADAQIAESRRQFDLIQGLLSPYVNAGTSALQSQLDLMGLGGRTATNFSIEEFTTGGTPTGNSQNGLMAGANGLIAGIGGQGQQNSPLSTRFRVGDREFGSRAEAQSWIDANQTTGLSAQDAQRNAIAGIENGSQFGALVKQGEYALNANAAATGGLRGGNNQAALAQFRPQMLQALIDKQLANLGGIAANGQNAAGMTGTAAQNTGAQVNAALGDRGAAQAGAYLAQGQAWANAGSGILNTLGSLAQPPTPGGGAWQRWSF